MTRSSQRHWSRGAAGRDWGLGGVLVCSLVLQLAPCALADQVKADNTSDLNTGPSWVSGTVPAGNDLAVFNNILTAGRTVNLGGNCTWKGLSLSNPGGNITIQDHSNTNSTPHSLRLGTAGIDMSAATADLTFTVKSSGEGPLIVLGASQTWNVGNGHTLKVDGSISGTNTDLTKSGEGILLLRSAANSWSGNTFVKQGILRSGSPNTVKGSSRLPTTTVLTLGDSLANTCGTFDLHGFNQVLAGLTTAGTGTANLIEGSGKNSTMSTLTIDNTADYTYSGGFGNPSDPSMNLLTLVKQGTGTFTLANVNGINTYTGDTTVSEGTLKLGASEQIPGGSSAGNLIVNGTFDLNGFSETVNGLRGSGVVDDVARGGTSTLVVGDNDASSTNTIAIWNTSGTVNLVKTGAGTLALNGASTYRGFTMVAGGTLALLPTSISSASVVIVNDGATLALSAGAGQTMTNSVLTLGNASGATLHFDLGSAGNPSAPLINATNLAVNGTLNIAITGLGLSPGQFTLVKYAGMLGGSSHFAAPSLPPGMTASVVNTGHSIDLNISSVLVAPIVLDKSQTNQTFWGIGAAASGPSSVLQGFPADVRSQILDRLFLNSGTNAGLSIVRMGIKQTLSPSQGVWNWSKDSAQRWFAQEALSRGCTQFIAVPWTPPAWMKTTTNAIGGELSTNYYDVFPSYLYTWTTQYATAYGLPIKGISIQNEPDIDYVSYACCGYSAAQMNIVAGKVADYFQARHSSVLVGAPECCSVKNSLNMLNKMPAATLAKLGWLPTHNYGTANLTLTGFGQPTLCTEVCNRTNDASLSEALYWASAIYTNLARGEVGYLYWWLVNDKASNPRESLISLWPDSGTYSTPKRFFIFAQYSRALRPADIAIDAAATADSPLQVIAAKDPSDSLAKLVVVNPGDFDVAAAISGLGGNSLLSIYRTSATEDFQPLPAAMATAGSLSYLFPSNSVTTLLESFQQPLVWDADPTDDGPQDGGGLWDTASLQWWSGSNELVWNSAWPLTAAFGSANGAAGTVSLGPGISTGGLTFHPAGSGSYTISGGPANNSLTLAGSPVLRVDANCAATISARLSGAGFQKVGDGTLMLAGASTYGGPTLVSGGTLQVSGSICNASSIEVTNTATLELAGGALTNRLVHIWHAAVLSGCGMIAASLVNDGTVLGGCGTNSSLAFTGTVTNNGTMRFSGGSALSATGLFVNNGTLDLMTGATNLPPNLINNGLILGPQSVRISRVFCAGSAIQIQLPGYAGHLYQLQRTDSLTSPAWTNIGAAQPGNGSLLTLPDPDGASLAQRFYRVAVLQ